jgi:transcriptional regulator with XRE-family HTH domain
LTDDTSDPERQAIAAKFAANVKRCRREAVLTQVELGRRSGFSGAEISGYERASRVPRLGALLRLAGALAVEPAKLTEGIVWKPRTVTPPIPPAEKGGRWFVLGWDHAGPRESS